MLRPPGSRFCQGELEHGQVIIFARYDLILKKRTSRREINYLISGYVKGTIPDYQMSALATAIYFQA